MNFPNWEVTNCAHSKQRHWMNDGCFPDASSSPCVDARCRYARHYDLGCQSKNLEWKVLDLRSTVLFCNAQHEGNTNQKLLFLALIYNSRLWLWCRIIKTPCYGSPITPGLNGVPRPPHLQHLATTWPIIRETCETSSLQLVPAPVLSMFQTSLWQTTNQTISIH